MKAHAHAHNHKFQEAVHLLNEAAREKKGELYTLAGERYSGIKKLINKKTHNGIRAAGKVKSQFIRTLHEEEKKMLGKGRQFNREVHKNPWLFMGWVAAISLAAGAMLAGKRKSRRA